MSASIREQTKDHPHREDGGHGERYIYQDVYDPEDKIRHLGVVLLQICTTCPHVRAVCQHTKNTWKHLPDCDGYQTGPATSDTAPCSGCLLQCDLCGADGT